MLDINNDCLNSLTETSTKLKKCFFEHRKKAMWRPKIILGSFKILNPA